MSQRATRFGYVGAMIVLAGSVVTGALLPHAHAASGTLSGVSASSTASATAFGDWRGAPVGVVNAFMPKQTWAQMEDPTYGGPDSWKGTDLTVSWSVTMLPNSGGSIATGATGAYDVYFDGMARKLVADGQGDSIIRLGWEMNGPWMTWNGLHDPTSYVAYWRQIVTTMRSVPGAHFRFLWAPANGQTFDLSTLYPGDDYVDEVGMSVYDWGGSSFGQMDSDARWNKIYNGLDGAYGLAWLSSLSATHHKPMGFGEWGLAYSCDSTSSGGDDPSFIQHMHDFFAENDVAFETYFEIDPTSCEQHSLTSGRFPAAAALYRKLFSGPLVAKVRPATTGLPAQGTDVLRVSTSPDRSAPLALAGSDLNGWVYVSAVPPTTAACRVSFYLDGATSPTHVETTAPYDLVGGGTTALPLNADALAPGQHTLVAVVTAGARTDTYTAAFVSGPDGGATPSPTPTPPVSSTPPVSPTPPASTTPPVSSTPPATPTSPPGSTPPGTRPMILGVSLRADRSHARALQGARISRGRFYAFVANALPGTSEVSFYLDEPATSVPTHVEHWSPWDFAGGQTTIAHSTRTRPMTVGTHVLTVVVSGSAGTETLTSTFTIR